MIYCTLHKLLGTDAAETAWNHCASVVDYGALRKDVVMILAERAAEVQGLVTKLQKTQRAAEQTLDRHFFGMTQLPIQLAWLRLLRYAKICSA